MPFAGAVHNRVFRSIAFIGENTVFQIDSGFDGIDLGVRKDYIVIDHVVPRVCILDMKGVNGVGHDVGEGLIVILGQTALFQLRAVRADTPDFQIGRTIRRMK